MSQGTRLHSKSRFRCSHFAEDAARCQPAEHLSNGNGGNFKKSRHRTCRHAGVSPQCETGKDLNSFGPNKIFEDANLVKQSRGRRNLLELRSKDQICQRDS